MTTTKRTATLEKTGAPAATKVRAKKTAAPVEEGQVEQTASVKAGTGTKARKAAPVEETAAPAEVVEEAIPATSAKGKKKAKTVEVAESEVLGRFQVEQQDLRLGTAVLGCFSGNTTELWKEATVLETATDSLILSRTTGQLTIQTTVPAVIPNGLELQVAVSGKMLNKLVTQLAEGVLPIEVGAEQVKLGAKKGGYRMRTFASESLPDFPKFELEPNQALCLPAQQFLDAIRMVIPAAASGKAAESSPVLASITVELVKDGEERFLVLTTSNGHCLSRMTLEIDDDVEPFAPVAIPMESINEMLKAVRLTMPEEIMMQVWTEQGCCEFAWGQTKVRSSVYTDGIPNFSQLLSGFIAQERHNLMMERTDMQPILKRFGVVLEKSTNKVLQLALGVDEGSEQVVTLKAESGDELAGEETIKAVYPSELNGFEIAANLNYLRQGINSIESRVITLQLHTPLTPILIRPTQDENLATPPDYIGLIMPIQIRS